MWVGGRDCGEARKMNASMVMNNLKISPTLHMNSVPICVCGCAVAKKQGK